MCTQLMPPWRACNSSRQRSQSMPDWNCSSTVRISAASREERGMCFSDSTIEPSGEEAVNAVAIKAAAHISP